MMEYKGFVIEENFYGNNKFSVQYNGDDLVFSTREEAIEFIDSIAE